MKREYRIGIDIGGTNTDGVLVDNITEEILHFIKLPTTNPINTNLFHVIQTLLARAQITSKQIRSICIGTTYAINAILQERGLYRTGIIRLAGHFPNTLHTGYNWPTSLLKKILVDSITIDGGYECDGRKISSFDSLQASIAIQELVERGAEALGIVGTFSLFDNTQELKVKKLIQEIVGPHFPITMSYQVGSLGFMERENSTLLNCALKKVMVEEFADIQLILKRADLNCPLLITQNNGTLITLQEAIENPILTIAAGPSNSFIGSGRLIKHQEAIVIDIGGSSTDIGILKEGFPRRSLNGCSIGDVALNFTYPDMISLALGGGSYISFDHNDENFSIGPYSCAKRLNIESQAYGGEFLTLTDAAIKLQPNLIEHTNSNLVKIEPAQARKILQTALNKIEQAVSKIEGIYTDLPIILVGGGANLFPRELLPKRFVIPKYANIANAYGAALAEVSGVVDTVLNLLDQETELKRLEAEASAKAIAQGADPTKIRLVEQEIIPYSYVPNNLARVRITVAGPMVKEGERKEA